MYTIPLLAFGIWPRFLWKASTTPDMGCESTEGMDTRCSSAMYSQPCSSSAWVPSARASLLGDMMASGNASPAPGVGRGTGVSSLTMNPRPALSIFHSPQAALDGGVVCEYAGDDEEFVHRAATVDGALAEAPRATRVRKGEGVVGQTAITLHPA